APGPKPMPPITVRVPPGGPLVAQIPLQLPDAPLVESVCVLLASHDAVVYDLAQAALANVYTGARLLRQSNIWRSYQVSGHPAFPPLLPGKSDGVSLAGPRGPESPTERVLEGYDRLTDGVRIRWKWRFASGTVAAEDALRLPAGGSRRLVRELLLRGIPA